MTDGVTITMSPAQLAAVMTHDTVQAGGQFSTRLWGALTVLGGTVELVGAGALCVAPEPTMLTKVGCVGLGAHGADTFSTGARQVWTGQHQRSLTERGVSGVAQTLGADRQTADNIGLAVDLMVPLGAALIAGAVRVASVRAGRISLVAHEAAAGSRVGGHTIARHVARTEAQMRTRLATMSGAGARVSSFKDLATAERAISEAVRANRAAIEAWARGGGAVRQAFDHRVGRVIGQGVSKASSSLDDLSSVRVVFKRELYNGKPYYILTAFPI